jgi:hypothetical protein
MVITEKKQIELLLLEYFRQLCPVFPQGKIIVAESPDFIVDHSPKKKTGIELVRLHPAYMKSSPDFVPLNIMDEGIAALVVKKLAEMLPRKLFIKMFFKEIPELDQQSLGGVSQKIAGMIAGGIPLKSHSFFYRRFSGRDFLPGLDSILVIYHPALSLPVCESALLKPFSFSILEDISWSVGKKEEKMPLYFHQGLHQYWLLITTDSLGTGKRGSLSERIRNLSIHSEFHRIFLLETLHARVTDLL